MIDGTVLHVCGPMKMTDEWFRSFAEEVRIRGLPACQYCGKRCRRGSFADHLFPYHDDYSYHVACKRAHAKEKRDEP